jgi:uncharacterized protein with von Willebrand factor type A (vWA) domain
MDHTHYTYSALPHRPREGHGASGVQASVVLFLEHWDAEPVPGTVRDPRFVGEFGSFSPDYRSWTQREHGLRVGVFRVLDALAEAGIVPAVAANARAVERLPALVERLARQTRLVMPELPARRTRPGWRGPRPHWPGVMRRAARSGGELLELPRLQRRRTPLPLMVLIDVSGSMERYIRMLLAFLHAATRTHRQRDVMAFGMNLTDLRSAFALADTDAMLEQTNRLIRDYAGGTRLGESLAQLRRQHGRRLIGRRTVVLLITDGLDTGEPGLLDEQLQWLRLHSRRLLWLNPLMRFEGYAPLARGAAALHAQAHAMLAVHNLSRLQDLASSLARLLRA